jgi:hypothetical protein
VVSRELVAMPKLSKKRSYEDEDDSGAEIAPKVAKKSKSTKQSSSGGNGKDADGNSFWEVSCQNVVGPSYLDIR